MQAPRACFVRCCCLQTSYSSASFFLILFYINNNEGPTGCTVHSNYILPRSFVAYLQPDRCGFHIRGDPFVQMRSFCIFWIPDERGYYMMLICYGLMKVLFLLKSLKHYGTGFHRVQQRFPQIIVSWGKKQWIFLYLSIYIFVNQNKKTPSVAQEERPGGCLPPGKAKH